jgi:hypothetical protein
MPLEPGQLPDVKEGQEVWVLCADGHIARKIARSKPFYVAVVPVSSIEDWELHRERARSEDWPAQDVVPGDQPPPWQAGAGPEG